MIKRVFLKKFILFFFFFLISLKLNAKKTLNNLIIQTKNKPTIKSLIMFDPIFLKYHLSPNHPEDPKRIKYIGEELKKIGLGSILQKGQKLASIIVANKNEIEADIRSELVTKIDVGSNVRIKISRNKIVQGKIRSIVGYEKIKTGSRVIRIYLPKNFPNSSNFPGKRLELSVPIGNPNLVLTVNKDSLIAEGKKKYVYVFKNGVALKKYILTGISYENDIEVLSGIVKGDLVIVKGNENLRPNQPVKINNKKKSFKRKNN